MPLTDEQLDRLEKLSAQQSFSDGEISELEQLNQLADAVEEPAQAETQADDGPSLGQIGAGLGAEVGISAAGQMAGAAFAPVTLGISYPVLSFSSGFGGSIAAQKIEGRNDISFGRALTAGLINLIPASSAAKGATKASVAIGREMVKGAAIGAGEATATAVIDERRAPTPMELASYAGAGAFFGGVLASTFKGGKKLWDKIKGKTPEQIDSMVRAGQITPDEFTPLGDNPEVIAAGNALKREAESANIAASTQEQAAIATAPSSDIVVGRGEGLRRFIASVAPSKAIGKSTNEEIIKYKQSVSAAREIGTRLGDKIDREVAKQADPKAAQDAVNAYLDKATDELPASLEGIKTDLDIAREKISELQASLIANIESGITADPNKRMELIQESMKRGNYLTREFRFFTDKKYNPTPAQRKAVIDELATESMAMPSEDGLPLSRESAILRAEKYLNELDNKKLTEVRSYNWYPSSIDGFMRRKKDLGPALLDYLGEIKQPGERVSGTIGRLSRAVYRDTADNEIRQNLSKLGLASAQKTDPQMVELQLRKNVPEGTGLYVAPHVQEAINELYISGAEDEIKNMSARALRDMWESGISLSKAVKVLANPPSYAVQFYGNSANLAAQGINPFGNGFARGMRLALSEYGPVERLTTNPKARRALLEDINQMTKYGIKGANILDSDIRSGLENGIFGKTLQRGLEPLSKLYTTFDTVGRFVAWKSNQKTLAKIFPNSDPEALKRYAANVTNDTYQNYERLSNSVKRLSRIGVIPQFASFTLEFARNQYHQGRIIRDMLSGKMGAGVNGLGPADVRAMQIEGAKRLAAITSVYGTTFAAVKMFNRENNVDQETENALRDVAIPDYDQSRLLAISLDPETMTGRYANPSYVIPHAVGLSAFEAGLNGAEASTVADILKQELVGEGSFFARSLYSTVLGYNARTGKPLSAETEPYKQAADRINYFIEDAFSPGIAREIKKFGQAKRGQGELRVEDVVARQFGARFNPINVTENARFKFRTLSDRMRMASSNYTSARDYRNLSPEDVQVQYEKSNAARKDAMAIAARHVESLRTLGYPDAEIATIMKEGGLGSKDILAAFDGETIDLPKVKRNTPTEYWDENLSMLSPREQAKEIGRLARSPETVGLAKSLEQKRKQEIKNETLKIDAKDKLILSLGVSDGERAAYLHRKAMQSGSYDAYVQSAIKKGLINQTVMLQMETMRALNKTTPSY